MNQRGDAVVILAPQRGADPVQLIRLTNLVTVTGVSQVQFLPAGPIFHVFVISGFERSMF